MDQSTMEDLTTFLDDLDEAMSDGSLTYYLEMMAAAYQREAKIPIREAVLCTTTLDDGTAVYWFTTKEQVGLE